MNARQFIGAIAPFIILLSARQAFATPLYHLTPIVGLGGPQTFLNAINNNGVIVGNTQTPANNGFYPFIYSSGTTTNMATLGANAPQGHSSVEQVFDINDSGAIIGQYTASQPYLYGNGVFTALPLAGSAVGINDSGQIATTNGHDASIYENGTLVDLGNLGGSSSGPVAINNVGQVAGNSYLPGNSIRHAFLYSNGGITDLGSLGGFSIANALDDNGWVVGASVTTKGVQEPFLYAGGPMIDLGNLGGKFSSSANGINDAGIIVGDSSVLAGGTDAFLYENGTMYDLNNLLDSSGSGWDLEDAVAINNSGQIIGVGHQVPLGSGPVSKDSAHACPGAAKPYSVRFQRVGPRRTCDLPASVAAIREL